MIHKDLFGYIPPQPKPLPQLLLHEPVDTRWKSMTNYLDGNFTKLELLSFAEALTGWLSQYDVVFTSPSGQRAKYDVLTFMTKSSTAKKEVARGVAIILSETYNIYEYLKALSPNMIKLWQAIMVNIYIHEDLASNILDDGEEIIAERRTNYYSVSRVIVRNELKWFKISRLLTPTHRGYYNDYDSYLTVSSALHSIFFPILYPSAFEDSSSLSQLPEGNWRTMEFEADSHTHYQLFLSLIKQNALPVKKKGVSVTDMKRELKKMSLEEFFPSDSSEYRQNLRGFSYLQLLSIAHTFIVKKGTKPVYHETLRALFSDFKSLNNFLPTILYPHINGLTRQFTEEGKHTKLCQMLFTWMREEPEGWVALRDVIYRIYAISNSDNSTGFIPLVYSPVTADYSTHVINEYTGRAVTGGSYVLEFGLCGLQKCALLMASLGMAEVAVNQDQKCEMSPVDDVTYIRLTPLGRYALGVTDEYDAPEVQQEAYFELDPDRLIIRSLVSPNPYAQLLKDTSVVISKNRFETSALSFLANCHTRTDVEAKISIFRQFIADKLPPLWEQFFKQLLQHCHPLKEDCIPYMHYTLPPDNRELLQLLTTDPQLRRLVIRAEGYRILVSTVDLKKFENLLKKHGFLL